MLNKTISIDQEVNSLSDSEALIFTWIISFLNKNGCFHGDEKVIKSLVFPLKKSVTPSKIRAALLRAEQKTLVFFYSVGSKSFICYPKFERNQPGLRKDREGLDGIPEPKSSDLLPQKLGKETESCGNPDAISPQKVKVKVKGVIPNGEGEGVRCKEEVPPPAAPLSEKEKAFFAVYEKYLGTVPSILVSELRLATNAYPLDWVQDAFITMSEANVDRPCWKYVRTILDRWASEGRKVDKPKGDPTEDPNEFARRYGHLLKKEVKP
jgi:hypothetical protein